MMASPRLSKSSIDPGIPGEPVDITNLPAGCAFAPRCQYRLERCGHEMPPLRDLGGRAVRCWVGEVAPLGSPTMTSDPALAAMSPPVARGGADGNLSMVVIEHVTKVFPVAASGATRRGGGLTAVRDVTLRIASGETLAVVGESGSGKSTLGRLVLGLSRPTSGSVRVEGADPASPRSTLRANQRLQAVFQDPNSSLDPRMTVRDAVEEPLRNLGWDAGRRRARVEELLAEVRLPSHFLTRYPRQLSGGQAQRVAIARALAPNPSLVVLDEPTASLDVSIQAYVLRLLADLRAKHGLTYLFISHDLAAVRVLASRIAVMYLGNVVEEGMADDVFSAPQHPYTAALLSALPDIDAGSQRRRIILTGEQPSPIDAPSGCPFRTRCPIAQAICATDAPPLAQIADSHRAACHFPGQLSSVGQPVVTSPAITVMR
jgi:peptide/nickel transport system ATP-binding protein